MTKRAGFAALCAATCVVVGCGGSSRSSTTARQGPTQHAFQTPSLSNADVVGASRQDRGPASARRHTPSPGNADIGGSRVQHISPAPAHPPANPVPDRVVATGTVQKARVTPGSYKDNPTSVIAKPLNPCTLVRATEAQAITGTSIVATNAPLGPTCVYTMRGSKTPITLAVESERFSQVAAQMSHRQLLTVRSRQAYCGRLGAQMLFVPLTGGRVLNVTAPCAVAQRFATLALSRLAA